MVINKYFSASSSTLEAFMADEEKLWQVNTCTHTHTHVHTDADLLVHNSKPNRSGSSGSTNSFAAFTRTEHRAWQFVSRHDGIRRSETKAKELLIFARMLVTKKRFLDINRRAVSKRS